jgi:formiminoglutamate deiminase
MYAVALRIGPEQLRAVAAQLYVELLRGGYTHVCEFHYLRRDRDGSDHADPLAMSWALADAAVDAGIGLTILPVLYERAGFAADALREDQRRFRSSPAETVDAAERIRAAGRPLVDSGLAIHSLRAASAASIAALGTLADGFAGPIHIHVAEQTAEVDECIAATGARPIEWLVREGRLDARWQLVHATHSTAQEIAAVAASGAGIVLCPSTEANLGDGLCDLPGWLDAGVPMTMAPTARRRATGARSCACSNTASAWRFASATSPPRPSSASRRAPSDWWRACSPAAPPRPGSRRGDSAPARAPMCSSSIHAATRCWASRRSGRSTRSCSAARPRRGAT